MLAFENNEGLGCVLERNDVRYQGFGRDPSRRQQVHR
jgi:hypothetical protein